MYIDPLKVYNLFCVWQKNHNKLGILVVLNTRIGGVSVN